MRSIRLALFILHCTFFISLSPDRPAYRLYNQHGKAISYQKLLRQAADADIVLFGELHNNPICHWLELQLTKDLYALKKEQLVLGGEMFESDNQTALTSYVQKSTTDKEFAKQARLWPNYDTDYRPLTDFARSNQLPFVATNVPRRYASLVARQGLNALDTVSNKKWIAPLPLVVDLNLPGYKGMLDMMANPSHGGPASAAKPTNPTSTTTIDERAANFARAQAIKDATMAHFILQNWQQGKLFLHFNGDYHSKNFEGISWYLNRQRPTIRIITISSVEQETVVRLQANNQNTGTAILAIPADMSKSY